MGKTSSSIEAFAELKTFGEANRLLVLAPKRVALNSWPDERRKFRESFGHLSIEAAIGTPDERLAALRSNPDILTINYDNIGWLMQQYGEHWPFDMVVADECFPAGTLVTVREGQCPIESIKPGTEVLTRKGFKRVTRTYRKRTESLVEVRTFDGARVVCTPSHRFWTTSGWKEAQELRATDTLCSLVQKVRNPILHSEKPRWTVDGSFLRSQLSQQFCFEESHTPGKPPTFQPSIGQLASRERLLEQGCSDASIDTGEIEQSAEGARLAASRWARRERAWDESSGAVGLRTSCRGVGLELTNTYAGFARAQNTDELQTGLRVAGSQNRFGDRRHFSQGLQDSGRGQKEDPCFGRTRVAGVSAFECASGTTVFDLEVEDAHEFFAGGILVHNCTRLKGLRVSLQQRQKKDGTMGKVFLAGQGSKRAKTLASVAHAKVRRWVNLTGSPAPNGLQDLWGVQWYVDAGKRLMTSFDGFSKRWFRPDWGSSKEQQRMSPLPHAQGEIERLLAQTSITVDARDWFDIKEPIERHIMIDLPPAARKQYDEMQRDLFTWIEQHPLEAFSAGTKATKCLQLASGSVILDRDGNWLPVHDEKLEALKSIVEETTGENLLVAYQYRADVERILKAFPFARKLDANPQTLRDFQDGKIRMLLAHPKSAGHGLDMQHNCHIMVDYSSGFNLEEDEQIIERIGPTRQAQMGRKIDVWRYRIVARDTLEETAVLPALKRKMDVQDALKAAMKTTR